MITSRVSVVSSRTVALALVDALCGILALALATAAHHGVEAVSDLLSDAPRLLVPGLLLPMAFGLCGVYDLRPSLGSLVRDGRAPILVCLAIASLSVSLTAPAGARFAATYVAILVPGLVVVRSIFAWLDAAGHAVTRAVVVGNVDQASRIVKLLALHPNAGIRLVGVAHAQHHLDRAAGTLADLPALGGADGLEEAVVSSGAELVLVGAANPDWDRELVRHLRALRLRGVAVLDYMGLYERVAREIPLAEVDERWLFRAALSCSRLHIRSLKRLMDVSVCVLLAVPAAILFALSALAIRLTSPGPVVFRQERLGLGGKTFWLLKLRTMRADAEKLTGPVWSTDDDPRVTKVGRILRKFRLDELPQIVNVLRGDMSLVGPRPERPILARQICEKVPLFPERLLVRPGITGWAQVMAPYASTVADSHRKLQFDLYYIKNLSFWLDVLVIAKTASTMLFGRERAQGGMAAGHQLEQGPAAASSFGRPLPPERVPSRESTGSFFVSKTG